MSSIRMNFRYLKSSLGACLVGNIQAMCIVGLSTRVALPAAVARPVGGRHHPINVPVALAAGSCALMVHV